MEHKKTKIAIIIVIILIVAFIAVSYVFSQFNLKQVNLLTEEANKLLKSDLVEDVIDFDIKTDKDYAKVEKTIKEYVSKIRNIYVEMEEMVSSINPNSIFSAQNMNDDELKGIDNIIKEYKDKCQNLIKEYEELITENKILEAINNVDISARKDYYINLYKEIMLSESMQIQYTKLQDEIKNEKGNLYEKINKIEKTKEFLIEYKDSWTIKDNKIQFNSLNRMTEYYNLINQIID